MTPMPILYRLVGVPGEVPLATIAFLGYLAPRGSELEHDPDLLRRLRQGHVDGRGERMNQLWPAWIVDPEGAATSTTEVPPDRADLLLGVLRVPYPRLEGSDVLFPFHL